LLAFFRCTPSLSFGPTNQAVELENVRRMCGKFANLVYAAHVNYEKLTNKDCFKQQKAQENKS